MILTNVETFHLVIKGLSDALKRCDRKSSPCVSSMCLVASNNKNL